jgi:hypothetical protein
VAGVQPTEGSGRVGLTGRIFNFSGRLIYAVWRVFPSFDGLQVLEAAPWFPTWQDTRLDEKPLKGNAMKPICMRRRFTRAALALAAALFLATRADATAGDFYQSYSPAKVIAHLQLSGARQMFLRQEGKTQYLYVQRPPQQGFTVIDVTKPDRPKVVNRVSLETITVVGSGFLVTETPDKPVTVDASHAAGNPEGTRTDGAVPESVHVLDVSDPLHPRRVPAFNRVTSVLTDDARGLIFVANDEGVWILLHQKVLRRHECSSSDAISNLPNCD